MADAGADIAFRSIAALGRDYRRGALSPTAVVEACLQRIDRDDGPLNAIVSTLAESARAGAATAEKELAAGRDRGPLHGIPVGIKDLVDIAGTVTGFGSDPVFAAPATRDAAMVAHLREAGAVLIAKTNLLEFAYGAVNPRVGQTNNPWTPAAPRAAPAAARLRPSPPASATRPWGPIPGVRSASPAAYCGAVGLKPTYGLVPLAGVSMLSWSLDHAGPIARSCADAAALLGGLTGTSVDASPASLRGLRFGLIAALRDYDATTPGVRAGMDSACAVLRDAGAAIEEVEIEALSESAEALLHVLLPEAGADSEAAPSKPCGRIGRADACAAGARLRAAGHRSRSRAAVPGASSANASSTASTASTRCSRPVCRGRRRPRTPPSTPPRAMARCCAARRPTSAACRASSSPAGGGGRHALEPSAHRTTRFDERLLQIGAALEPAFLLGPPPGYGSSLSAAEGLGVESGTGPRSPTASSALAGSPMPRPSIR